jgi:hypothetical protein
LGSNKSIGTAFLCMLWCAAGPHAYQVSMRVRREPYKRRFWFRRVPRRGLKMLTTKKSANSSVSLNERQLRFRFGFSNLFMRFFQAGFAPSLRKNTFSNIKSLWKRALCFCETIFLLKASCHNGQGGHRGLHPQLSPQPHTTNETLPPTAHRPHPPPIPTPTQQSTQPPDSDTQQVRCPSPPLGCPGT